MFTIVHLIQLVCISCVVGLGLSTKHTSKVYLQNIKLQKNEVQKNNIKTKISVRGRVWIFISLLLTLNHIKKTILNIFDMFNLLKLLLFSFVLMLLNYSTQQCFNGPILANERCLRFCS